MPAGVFAAVPPDGSLFGTAVWDDPSVAVVRDVACGGVGEFTQWGDQDSHTLDVDELIRIGRARLSRDMTDEECRQYFRGPCP
jgi:hypothetical protein